MRRLLLAAVLLSTLTYAQQPTPKPVAHPAFPTGESTPLGSKIATLLADPSVSRAHWGIAVTALDGTPIYGLDEGKLFRPASNAKLFTTAAAMALLSPDARTETRLIATGAQEQSWGQDGILHADLELTGQGDANLGVQALDDMAATLAEHGVHKIMGSIVGIDAGWPYDPLPDTWGLDDVLWGYGAPVSALTVNDNQIKLTVTPGPELGKPATVAVYPVVQYYRLDFGVLTVAKGEAAAVTIRRKPGSRTVSVTGTVAMGKPDVEELAIDDPAEYAAEALKVALVAHHIVVDGATRVVHNAPPKDDRILSESQKPVVTSKGPLPLLLAKPMESAWVCSGGCGTDVTIIKSPTVAEDVSVTMKESQNLHAEMLLHRLGWQWVDTGTNVEGVRVIRQWLLNTGLDGDDFVFYDGSGLSPHDLVTTRTTAQLLTFGATQPWFAQWKAALPIGGVDGTLSSRFKEAPLKGHVFAKTGTLGESRALSGYLDCASGKQVIFSIMVDNHSPASSADRTVMDKIVAAIAATQ